MSLVTVDIFFFFFQAEDGIRDVAVTGVQTCALPISPAFPARWRAARRCDISSKRSLRVPRRKPSRPCLAAKFHAFPRTSSIDLPPSSPGKKTKVHYESTEHLATRDRKSTRLNSSHG